MLGSNYTFLVNVHHAVADLVITQPDLAYAEERIHGRVDAHLRLDVVGLGLLEIGILALDLRQELLDAHRQGLELGFLDDDRVGPLGLECLDIKDALAGLADGVSGYMIARINVDFIARHGTHTFTGT